MNSKRDFLEHLPLFAALDDDELDELARIAQEFEFDPGATIAYQRDVADSLYIIHSGRLTARAIDRSGEIAETSITHYMPGDHFFEEWLFAENAHPATVQAPRSEGGLIVIIKKDDFLALVERYPRIIDKLEPGYATVIYQGREVATGLTLSGWQEARKTRVRADKQSAAISLLPDELVEYQARRSWKYLVLNELVLLFVLIVVPLITFLLLRAQVTEAAARGGNPDAWTTASVYIPLTLAAILGAIMGFRYLDWLNDYFVITNKHLAHREFDLVRFHINIKKLPVHQIQSVGTAKPNFWANLLNIGTARITTASQYGTILFDNIDDPAQVKDVYERLSRRGRNLDEAREQMSMRETIEGHFSVTPSYRPVANQDEDLPEPVVVMPNFFQRFWRRYQSRVEEKGVVTYRKHVFVLFRESIWPIGLGILVSVVIYLLSAFSTIATMQLVIVWAVFLFVDFLWFLWRIEDWRNDTFQVTDKFVIDIDRKPFGFGESRKQAGIDNVQNVNADRPGLLPTIFNYGDVIVETAGANADIVFEDVANPSQVQSDIFRRLDRARRKKRMSESANRRKEYSVLVDVYRQAMEQERIPRRTPNAADLETE